MKCPILKYMLAVRLQGIKCISRTAFNIVKFILTYNLWINSVLIIGGNHGNTFCMTFFSFH
jgi:hypothetical protein